jgi:RimJ/RimL family protein N-acetyltransferase
MAKSQVRIYKPEDLDRILELATELDSELAKKFDKPENPNKMIRAYREHYLMQGTKYQVLVAQIGEEIPGYVVGTPIVGAPEIDYSDYLDPYSTTASEVTMVFITANSRKKGLGKQLITSLTDHIMQFGHKELEAYVAKWNKPSIALFRALRFQEKDCGKRYLFTNKL